MSTAIHIDHVSKQYRLGEVGTGTLSHDLNRWWHRLRGKPDPYLKVGAENDRTQQGGDYVWALRDIHFDVEQGEVVGIIGRNGAGKSTLLKILSKVTSPTTGSIRLKGRLASLLEVGTGFHPEMTGRENIYMNGTIMGMTRHEIKARFDEIVEFAGVAKYVDTPVKRYSSGMTVRLGFAIAAHLEPEILVVDEVLAVGDAEFQKKAIGKMKDVSQGEGRTVLFVSHNMSSIENLCTRGILMDQGTVRKTGNIHECINLYLSATKSLTLHSLGERTDRQSLNRFKFTGIILYDIENHELTTLKSGIYCKIKIQYTIAFSINVIGIRILISDEKNTNRILLNTGLVGVTPKILNPGPKQEISFTIKKFPLPKGSYSIRLSCFSEDGVEDDIFDVLQFDVSGGDFYGHGKEAHVTDGVLVEFEASC